MKKIALVIFILAFSSSVAFAARPVPTTSAKNYNYNPTTSASEMKEAMNRLAKKMKKETDHLSVREKKTRQILFEAIGTAKEDMVKKLDGISQDAKSAVQDAMSGAKKEMSDASKTLTNTAGEIKSSIKANQTALTEVKTALDGNSGAISDVGYTLVILFVIGFGLVSWLIVRSQRKILGKLNTRVVIPEIASIQNDVGEIKDAVEEIKSVVKPDPFTLFFVVAGQDYQYRVPVNARGKFVSIYAPKVTDPTDMPATPAETVRATFSEEKDLLKSCKSAMKEYLKPTCDPIQKNLIDHLLSTGVLGKA